MAKKIDSELFLSLWIRKREGHESWLNRFKCLAMAAAPVPESDEDIERGRLLADSFLGDES